MIVVRVHEDEGVRTGLLVTEGPKYVSVIWPDSAGIKIRKLPKSRNLRITEMPDYPVRKAKVHLRRCGRNFGITKTAKRALMG